MPLIPSAALLVILTRPAPLDAVRDRPADAPHERTFQAGPKDPKEPKGQKPKPKQEKPKEEYPQFRLDDHPSIVFGKGSHLDLRARFSVDKADSEASTDDPAETSTTDLGKRRIGVSGEIANIIEFQIERELTDNDPWRDVYGEYKQFVYARDRKSTRLNSSHLVISYAVFCLKKKINTYLMPISCKYPVSLTILNYSCNRQELTPFPTRRSSDL